MVKIKTIFVACLLPVLLFFYTTGNANSEFQRWRQQQSQGVQRQKEDFQTYKDKRDKAFTAFLKAQWKAVDIVKGELREKQPKPDAMPLAHPRPEPLTATEKPAIISVPKPGPIKPGSIKPGLIRPGLIRPGPIKPGPAKQPLTAPVVSQAKGRPLNIDFYGRQIRLYYDNAFRIRLSSSVNKDAISDYWSALSQSAYEGLLQQLAEQKKALQLNDWAYASLIHKLALAINNKRRNESALLSWFLLAKSGYKARIAFNDTSIYLLLPAKQKMFEVSYFTFAGIRYYAVELDGSSMKIGRVYTYDGEYPDAINDLDMHVSSVVASNDKGERRHLSFEFDGKKYNINVSSDRGRIKFFSNYPQLNHNVYFSSGVSQLTATPLQKQLAAYMQGMSEQQAVNFLLRFVQTALQYKTDDQQFGQENYLFPEETLFYPYSDCEDRAVLFAWLVQSLLKLQVVGLDYPGHVAAAVHFNELVAGDSVNYQGKRYVVTDPTYTNANAGMSMPNFKRFKPAVISY